ncbi:class I SAM-dependent methyltransferase [Chitinilyticum aquatile]|uniref:class I SAM-dependent methyltransferase n=1 Tax=Chitinilyticum aquatile TaxID=362520 RepID=UPI00048E1408|nr:class I SAM-dependent methyltransferase [Chitinilyticum aquatile]
MSASHPLPHPQQLYAMAARASAARLCPEIGFSDPTAERLLYRWREFMDGFRPDLPALRRCCLTSAWLDGQMQAFLQQYPDALCINLGAGLDACHARQAKPHASDQSDWIDVDLPDVIALKARLLLPRCGYSLVSADVTRAGWTRHLPPARNRAILLRAEGLLGALDRAQVLQLLTELTIWSTNACAVRLAFDWHSPLLSRWQRLAGAGSRPGWALEGLDDLPMVNPLWRRTADFDLLAASGGACGGWNRLYRACTGQPLQGCQTLERY